MLTMLTICIIIISYTAVSGFKCDSYFEKPCQGRCIEREDPCPERPCRDAYREKWCARRSECTYALLDECCKERHCNDGTCRKHGERCDDESCEGMNWLDSQSCENEPKCFTRYEKCDGTWHCKEGTDEKDCPGHAPKNAVWIIVGLSVGGLVVVVALCYCCLNKIKRCMSPSSGARIVRQPNGEPVTLRGTGQSQPLNITAGSPIFTPPGQAPPQAMWSTPPQPRGRGRVPGEPPRQGNWGYQQQSSPRLANRGAMQAPYGGAAGTRPPQNPTAPLLEDKQPQPPSYHDVMLQSTHKS